MRQIYEFLDHPGPIAFAHRGGGLDGLENSMAAFERAIRLGYRYIETDVHATADRVLLAFHDHTLDRVTDRTGRITRMPYREVAHARIGGVEPIPRLEDVLASWPDLRVNIDIKSASAIGPLAEVLHRTRSLDRVCVASFSDRRLALTRARIQLLTRQRVCSALGPRGVAALRAMSGRRRVRGLDEGAAGAAACVQVPVSAGPIRIVTPAFIDTAHQLGLQVHVWTVNDRATMENLLDLGVDGIITDELETLREVMISRGRWRPQRTAAG